MAACADPLPLPIPESPHGTQPGGEGFFSRCEIAWGRFRRWYLRRFRPNHESHWLALRQGDDPQFDRDVIDPRDLKYIRPVCRFWFHPKDDIFAAREHYGFARWGYAELVGFTIVLSVLGGLFCFLAGFAHWVFLVPALVVFLAQIEVIWFFRDPPRTPPADETAVVSPADGTVSHVETIDDPDFSGPVVRISIFLSVFNVHVNRVPRTGRVTAVRYFRGEFMDARNADCAQRNEQLWIDLVDTSTGAPIRVKQVSGAIARRIVCALKPGDDVEVGQRFGMIKFGSRTDLLVPAERVGEVIVRVGDKVRGAASILLRMR